MAKYFRTAQHLRNFPAQVARDNGVDRHQLLNLESYEFALSSLGLEDEFGLAVRECPTLMHEDDFWNWLRSRNWYSKALTHREELTSKIATRITAAFEALTAELESVTGVYAFFNASDVPLYVGMSTNLGLRILQSFDAKFACCASPVYVSGCVTNNNGSDAALLEVYMICKLKPAMNKRSKFRDELTVPVNMDLERWLAETPRCLCNLRERKRESNNTRR